jgi:hypothetical protein
VSTNLALKRGDILTCQDMKDYANYAMPIPLKMRNIFYSTVQDMQTQGVLPSRN